MMYQGSWSTAMAYPLDGFCLHRSSDVDHFGSYNSKVLEYSTRLGSRFRSPDSDRLRKHIPGCVVRCGPVRPFRRGMMDQARGTIIALHSREL